MKSFLKKGLGAACALAIGLVASAGARADKLADIISSGVVRVVVFADVPPFGSQNANRELEGFDIDMAKLVAKSLGVKLELVPAPAASRIPFLLTDKADMNIAAMSITAERAKQVMYSAPYADTSLAVYGPKNMAIKSAADLGQNKISVAKGTTEDSY
jgi:polar amino acid transport system substrate-binding protein